MVSVTRFAFGSDTGRHHPHPTGLLSEISHEATKGTKTDEGYLRVAT
jgi:hypothetical protein